MSGRQANGRRTAGCGIKAPARGRLSRGLAFGAALTVSASLGFLPPAQAQEKTTSPATAPVTARAIFLPDAPLRDLVRPIFPVDSGLVDEIRVEMDELVKKGQVLLTLRSPEVERKIAAARATLAQREAYLQTLTKAVDELDSAVRKAEATRRTQVEEALAILRKQKEEFAAFVEARNKLLAKGHETNLSNYEFRTRYDQMILDINRLQVDLAESQMKTADTREGQVLDLIRARDQVDQEATRLATLERQYEEMKDVRAPRDGQVNSLYISIGAAVTPRDVLLTLSNTAPTLNVYALVDAQDAPLVRTGMTAEVVPAHAHLPAPLRAKVTQISATPLARKEIETLLFDADLTAYLSGGRAVYLVVLRPEPPVAAGASDAIASGVVARVTFPPR
ncbi:HlyD family efflux transporter periplasmic adaptor subunit [Aquabacter sp. L1I39]|uniref:HlyD family secretion protein n=1 Tax=Aquabacter sp. L1I39 TaxID=2820278 RepID=UPI001ADB3294|nr:HlyD family efflux transporter periplasmic adaptor subunit [Aquabacter sp. L1I39]QTL05201.1 HlyD family efflux transporter periplasmic adaptor subunit [Aquabacter sp. L1I39]